MIVSCKNKFKFYVSSFPLLLLASLGLHEGRKVCLVAREVYLVARDVCLVSKEVYPVAREVCLVAREVCLVTR